MKPTAIEAYKANEEKIVAILEADMSYKDRCKAIKKYGLGYSSARRLFKEGKGREIEQPHGKRGIHKRSIDDRIIMLYLVKGWSDVDIAEYEKLHVQQVRALLRRNKVSMRGPRTLEGLDVPQVLRSLDIPKYVAPEKTLKEKERSQHEDVILLLSDWQVGQKNVSETESEAIEFFYKCFEKLTGNVIRLMSLQRPSYEWDTMFIPVIGDIVEGEGIYPNQPWESFNVAKQLEVARDGMVDLFDTILEHYDVNIISPWVRGNHGRIGRYNSTESNWDTLLALIMEEHYRNESRVKIKKTAEFFDILRIRGHTYLLTHGETLYGGSGGRSVLPSAKLDAIANRWQQSICRFDMLLTGHWHNGSILNLGGFKVMVNGCMRYNDFPLYRMGVLSAKEQFLFGVSDSRPMTWRYSVETGKKEDGMPDWLKDIKEHERKNTVA